MTKFQIVTNSASQSERFDTFDPVAAFAARGFQHIGTQNATHLRKELQGQPQFAGLTGPMWGGTDPDGTPVIRYEDWESYKVLSS